MSDLEAMTYVTLDILGVGKSSLILLGHRSLRAGNKAEGKSHRERLSEKTSKEDTKVCTQPIRLRERIEEFASPDMLKIAIRSTKVTESNEQVTLQNQDPVKRFKAGLKPSVIDLEALTLKPSVTRAKDKFRNYPLEDEDANAN